MRKKWFVFIGIELILITMGILFIYQKNHYIYKVHKQLSNELQMARSKSKKAKYWLFIPGTNINYNVEALTPEDANELVNGKNFEFVFTSSNYNFKNKKDVPNYVFVSGHNIRNLMKEPEFNNPSHRRMEQLLNFYFYDFAKEHLYMYIETEEELLVYKIFSVAFYQNDAYLRNDELNEKDFMKKLKLLKDNSLYHYPVDVSKDDKILSVITCTRAYQGRTDVSFVVSGKLVDSISDFIDRSPIVNQDYKEENVIKEKV